MIFIFDSHSFHFDCTAYSAPHHMHHMDYYEDYKQSQIEWDKCHDSSTGDAIQRYTRTHSDRGR